MASIDTREAPRDAHLRSADFFDAENHPQMLFRSTHVESAPDGKLRLVGDLTIRGTTREVVLDGEYEGPLKDAQGQRRFGFELKGRIDREAFGLTWNMPIEAGGSSSARTWSSRSMARLSNNRGGCSLCD